MWRVSEIGIPSFPSFSWKRKKYCPPLFYGKSRTCNYNFSVPVPIFFPPPCFLAPKEIGREERGISRLLRFPPSLCRVYLWVWPRFLFTSLLVKGALVEDRIFLPFSPERKRSHYGGQPILLRCILCREIAGSLLLAANNYCRFENLFSFMNDPINFCDWQPRFFCIHRQPPNYVFKPQNILNDCPSKLTQKSSF